jgi:hypothetical protein
MVIEDRRDRRATGTLETFYVYDRVGHMGLRAHGWIAPVRASGDSGFVHVTSGYQGSGQPKRLPVDSAESAGGMSIGFRADHRGYGPPL